MLFQLSKINHDDSDTFFSFFIYLFIYLLSKSHGGHKNSKTTKARNLKFGQMIGLYMDLGTCNFRGATSVLEALMFLHHLEIPPLRTPPKWTLQILIFCLAQTRAPVLFFDINRYNRQIFRHSLRVPPPPPREAPQSGPPKTQIFARPNLRCLCFLYQ